MVWRWEVASVREPGLLQPAALSFSKTPSAALRKKAYGQVVSVPFAIVQLYSPKCLFANVKGGLLLASGSLGQMEGSFAQKEGYSL